MITHRFAQGDTVRCRNASGYLLTEGKHYVVLAYQPEDYDDTSAAGFTWPDYVQVEDDAGRVVMCHAHRFVKEADA